MFFTPSTDTCRRDDCKKFFLFNQASKFDEAKLEDKARSEYALTQIGLLHDIEEMADEQQLSYEERVVLCIRMPYPLMQTFKKWIVADMLKVMPKSRTAKALSYIYNIHHKLTRYHLNGKQKIDNNNGVYLKVLINWLKMHSVR